MISLLAKSLAIILALLALSSSVAFADVSSNPLNTACQTNDLTRNSPACKQAGSQGTTNPIAGPNGIINDAASILALIAGAAAVVMIIISGFKLVTSAGNAESISKARQRIIGSLVGLVVIALAWTIITYVTTKIIK